jgi:hypothetical protein
MRGLLLAHDPGADPSLCLYGFFALSLDHFYLRSRGMD